MSAKNFILPIDNCRTNLQCIQEILDKVCPQEATTLIEHLNELAAIIGLSAQTQASYKFHVLQQLEMKLSEAKEKKFPPSVMKAYAESCIPELMAEYELSERLNRGVTHKIDSVRSVLSYTKAENYASNFQRA